MYTNGFVAFIDVLGWSDVVERSKTDTQLAQQLRDVLESIENRIAGIVSGKGYSHGARAHQFSDAHFLTVDKGDDETRVGPEYVALWCRLLAREYLRHSLLVRGAVTIGQFFDNGFTCFGPAVTKAYRLEQSVTDPIIIVDPCKDVQDIFLDPEQYGYLTTEKEGDLVAQSMSPLAKTRDGRVFIDFLRSDVSSDHKFRPHDVFSVSEEQKLLEKFRNKPAERLSARSKIEWFLRYANADWRTVKGGILEQIDFSPISGARRRLTPQDYALVSTRSG